MSIGEGVEKVENWYAADGNVKCTVVFTRTLEASYELKDKFTISLSHLTLAIFQGNFKNIYSCKNININQTFIASLFILSKDLELFQMSINW